jgi:hypothetical protein
MFVDYAPKLEVEHVIWNSFDRRLWRIPQRGRATECPLLLSQQMMSARGPDRLRPVIGLHPGWL